MPRHNLGIDDRLLSILTLSVGLVFGGAIWIEFASPHDAPPAVTSADTAASES